MDFKVAGTESGITSLQMDIKVNGITEDIMEESLSKANSARLHILKEMNKALQQIKSSHKIKCSANREIKN